MAKGAQTTSAAAPRAAHSEDLREVRRHVAEDHARGRAPGPKGDFAPITLQRGMTGALHTAAKRA
eukprot:11193462-Lingulodinium_polyedra.AAC.1